MFAPRFFTLATALALLASPALAGPPDGLWYDPSKPGSGVAVQVLASSAGTSKGYAVRFLASGTWEADGPATMDVSTLAATRYRISDCTTLGGAFKAPTVQAAGSVNIVWQSRDSASLNDGAISGVEALSPFTFSTGAFNANLPLLGFYMAAGEGGTGWSVVPQGDQVQATAFFCDAAGNPVWAYIRGTPTLSNGMSYLSGPLLMGGSGVSLGNVTLQATRVNAITVTYPNGAQKSLTPWDFAN